MQTTDWIAQLKDVFLKPLPGKDAQYRMSPPGRRQAVTEKPFRRSGVLLLLYPYHDLISIVFIKRAEYNGIHSGQVSFPGGMFEEKDVTLEQTAVRETMEETGVKAGEINIIGKLTPLYIEVSNTEVFPFVAVCQQRPDFMHDPAEVQYVIEAPLRELLMPENCRTKLMEIGGKRIPVPYYDIQHHHIWGATAMILSEFLEMLKNSDE